MNPNDSEKFGFIRIDSEWVSDWFRLKNFFGLDRNETVWFGYKFRNDSQNFGLVRHEFQSETFARECMNWMGFKYLIPRNINPGESFGLKFNPKNSKFSESFRNFYPNQTVLFRFRRNFSIWSNPRPIQNQSELIRSIRMEPNFSESFGLIRIDRILRIESSNWPDWKFILIWIDRIHSD